MKNYSDDNNNRSQRRINVKKMILLKDLLNKPIKNITFKFEDFQDFYKLNHLSKNSAETEVKIILYKNDKIHTFQLKDKRKVNNQLLNTLNLTKNIVIE